MAEEKKAKVEESEGTEKEVKEEKPKGKQKEAGQEEKSKPKPKASKAKEKAPEESEETGDAPAVTADVEAALGAVRKLSPDERKQFITEYVKGLSVLELTEQVSALEDALGVTAAPVGVMAAVAPGAAQAAEEPEKSSFDVILKEIADKTKRVQVIKTVRDVLSVALKEAKELVDGAPCPVKEGAAKDEAEKIKESLEQAGATVELR